MNLSEVEKSVATRHNLALRATTHRLPYRLTISAGSVVLNPQTLDTLDTLEEMVSAADQSMYASKRQFTGTRVHHESRILGSSTEPERRVINRQVADG